MRDDLTQIVCILDRSGSMGGLERDTIGGFNAFIAEQKKVAGEGKVTVVLFDDKYDLLWEGKALKDLPVMTAEHYHVRGSTALLDAIGKSIVTVGADLDKMTDSEKPGRVIFMIITDGQENCSKEYRQEKVKEMIEHQQNKYSWQFIFLSADLSSADLARSVGIGHTFMYANTSKGLHDSYGAINCAVASYRSSASKTLDTSALKINETEATK